MERKNKFLIHILLLLYFFCLILMGCQPIQVTEKEMIGNWVSSDSAELSLSENGTFTLTGFNPDYWYSDIDGRPYPSKVNAKGTWSIKVDDEENPFLELDCIEVMDKQIQVYRSDLRIYQTTGALYNFIIQGSNSPFYNKPPWVIGIWEDGVDGGEFIGFHKKE